MYNTNCICITLQKLLKLLKMLLSIWCTHRFLLLLPQHVFLIFKFREISISFLKLPPPAWNFHKHFEIATTCLKFPSAVWNFHKLFEISTSCLKFPPTLWNFCLDDVGISPFQSDLGPGQQCIGNCPCTDCRIWKDVWNEVNQQLCTTGHCSISAKNVNHQ